MLRLFFIIGQMSTSRRSIHSHHIYGPVCSRASECDVCGSGMTLAYEIRCISISIRTSLF